MNKSVLGKMREKCLCAKFVRKSFTIRQTMLGMKANASLRQLEREVSSVLNVTGSVEMK